MSITASTLEMMTKANSPHLSQFNGKAFIANIASVAKTEKYNSPIRKRNISLE